jgi:CBS domain-containing protein
MLVYKAIEIFTSERTHYQSKPVADAVLQYVRGLKIAARCIVTRGIAGCYETGEVTTQALEILSFNLPIRIYIVVPGAETERVLAGLSPMIGDGIIALHDLQVVGHRVDNAFFPAQLRVRDVMTPAPQTLRTASPLNEAARLLLGSIYSGLPVVDDQGRPVGVITQGDLIHRGRMPLRLGLLAESQTDQLDEVLRQLADQRAGDIMSSPAITINEDQSLDEAVGLMLAKSVKRLPVVDKTGRLTGILSRLDIFKTVMQEAPDWKTFKAQQVDVARLRRVADIARRDTHTVSPETTIDEVIRTIDRNDIQRVAVVDAQGKLMGLISDRDLLRYFKQDQEGIRGLLAKVKNKISLGGRDELGQALRSTRAAEVMHTDLVTIKEDQLIEEAIGQMIDKALKRLPVVDDEGRFKGMISRGSLLRTGFAGGESEEIPKG